MNLAGKLQSNIDDYNRKRKELEEAMKKAVVRDYQSTPKPTDEQRWNAMWMYEEDV